VRHVVLVSVIRAYAHRNVEALKVQARSGNDMSGVGGSVWCTGEKTERNRGVHFL